MNKQSNTYIIAYATVLVVVVATVLSFAAIKLQPMQQTNVKIEKMEAILSTIGQGNDTKQLASNKAGYIASEYDKYITATYAIDHEGNKVEGVDAFSLLNNLPEAIENKTYPVFESVVDGKLEYIIPVTGKGLWGPVWGYLALADDCNTILGAKFDHQGETPGLGAEIATTPFEAQFIGKKLFNERGEFVSINLTKGAGSSSGNIHAVDAVSGGTLTSNGVKAMLKDCLDNYLAFFKKVAKGGANALSDAAETENTTDETLTEGGAQS